MLTTCGHTICSACLAELGTQNLTYTCPDDGKDTQITMENISSFPINQMVLMMVNNQIKESIQRQQNRTPPKAEDEYMNPQAEAEELNQLIKKMSVKLPRSENDEYESYISSNDSTTKTINNK